MPKIKYEGIVYASEEELSFKYWLDEAVEYGFVESYVHQPDSFELFPKVMMPLRIPIQLKTILKKEDKVFNKHVFTPDYHFIATDKFFSLNTDMIKFIPKEKESNNKEFWVDIKGTGFLQEGMKRCFIINQKYVYDKYGIIIHQVVMDDIKKKHKNKKTGEIEYKITQGLISKTWVPMKYRLTTKTKVIKKKYENIPTIKEFIKDRIK